MPLEARCYRWLASGSERQGVRRPSNALRITLNLEYVFPAVGFVTAVALFCLRPRVIRVAIACALLASSVGELVLMAPVTSPLDRQTLWLVPLALMFFPQAFLTVGGWAALFAGAAALVLRVVRTRVAVQTWILVGASALTGLGIGFVFCLTSEIVLFASHTPDQAFASRWRMAGTLAGAATGALCGAWRVDGPPINRTGDQLT